MQTLRMGAPTEQSGERDGKSSLLPCASQGVFFETKFKWHYFFVLLILTLAYTLV